MNSELYKYAGDSVHEGLLDFLNNIYRTEWEKGFNNGKKILSYLHIRQATNKRWKPKEELAYSMHGINSIVEF